MLIDYQYKYNHQEWQDELNLNVTAMDFRQYDNALGRFLNPDRLSELAPGITPYRFAFNNPNYWSDPTGLFESRNSALAHISTYGLIGATVGYNDGRGVWEITSGNYTFYQNGNNLFLMFDEPGDGGGGGGVYFNATVIVGGALTAGGTNGSWAGGSNVWGSGFGSSGYSFGHGMSSHTIWGIGTGTSGWRGTTTHSINYDDFVTGSLRARNIKSSGGFWARLKAFFTGSKDVAEFDGKIETIKALNENPNTSTMEVQNVSPVTKEIITVLLG